MYLFDLEIEEEPVVGTKVHIFTQEADGLKYAYGAPKKKIFK